VIGNLIIWAAAGLNFTASGCFIGRRYGRELHGWPNENGLWAVGFGIWAGLNLAGHDYLSGLVYGVVAVLNAWYWWRRKDRKRAAKALGYKARALVAALVERAREAAQPRPVLKPQRQGAS
jgi:hypothetical protein